MTVDGAESKPPVSVGFRVAEVVDQFTVADVLNDTVAGHNLDCTHGIPFNQVTVVVESMFGKKRSGSAPGISTKPDSSYSSGIVLSMTDIVKTEVMVI